jgi:DNA-directed RNA polymerase subunit RPC12/RpoP
MSDRTNAAEVYGCSRCGNTEGFTERNIVEINLGVAHFDTEGTVYSGESDIDWKTQRVNPLIDRPYKCEKCGTDFAKPVRIDPPGPIRVK